jgi:hypothetical protein
MRYRMIRGLGALLAVLVVVGAVWLVRGDPIGWGRDRWYDVRNTLEPVNATAAVDPPDQEIPDFGPGLAVDGNPDTAWATGWNGGTGNPECGDQPTTAGLLLTLARPADLREIRVLAGLPAGNPNRLVQNRPSRIELRFSDGTCQVRPLANRGDEQIVQLDPLDSTTTSLRVDVVDVLPPATGESELVAISDIALRARPAS